MKEKVLEAYARLAKDYELHVDEDSGANAYYERPAMLALLPEVMTGWSVLDAGCAAGWYTEQLTRRGAQVTAVDISPEMVAAAQRRAGHQAKVQVQDLNEPLPFAAEAFDLILSSLTLHYVEDWQPVFTEFRRVLRPGGHLLFSVHHPIMDFTFFERPDYFARELIVDLWTKKEAGEVEVTFYRRPLHEIINVTTDHFILDKMVEPKPLPEFLERLPESAAFYERLLHHPQFLIMKAHKAL
ncbi:class I SAM-dependent methyltransferase [Paenibacillus sp.]|uniref:class I SAM-dependent methyltransferase n=1 Tax=Paenibacillus sp. TaxID=58172 RepID=UPI00281C88C4|nr:class I SAM-dependent methyltransferase [Paenibacillus sp.]MDR0270240.1 methyltransferase domain-containing protein [Paenibacillus sp.]